MSFHPRSFHGAGDTLRLSTRGSGFSFGLVTMSCGPFGFDQLVKLPANLMQTLSVRVAQKRHFVITPVRYLWLWHSGHRVSRGGTCCSVLQNNHGLRSYILPRFLLWMIDLSSIERRIFRVARVPEMFSKVENRRSCHVIGYRCSGSKLCENVGPRLQQAVAGPQPVSAVRHLVR
jgi:hypothetical protein